MESSNLYQQPVANARNQCHDIIAVFADSLMMTPTIVSTIVNSVMSVGEVKGLELIFFIAWSAMHACT